MSLRTATLLAGLMLAAPVTALAAPAETVTVEKTDAPKRAHVEETASYAEREAQNQSVANYEGGQTVVIAMSGGALVVLLVLLLLL